LSSLIGSGQAYQSTEEFMASLAENLTARLK